jgi:hypothetical protein
MEAEWLATGQDARASVQERFIGCLLAARAGAPRPSFEPFLLCHLGAVAWALGPVVSRFLQVTTPALLRQLSRVTEPERVELRGRIKGRIDWSATYKGRLSQDNDPTLFVCRQVRRQYCTLENELFKHLLAALQALIADVPPLLREGVFWVPQQPDRSGSVRVALNQRYEWIRDYLGHIYLREVATPDRITARHLLKARTSKTEQYAEVAALYDRLTRLTETEEVGDLLGALRTCVVLPASLAGRGEQWVQLAAWALATGPSAPEPTT